MKKLLGIAIVLVCVFFITAMIADPGIVRSSPKGNGEGSPIPANIMKIADRSCVYCHSEPGNPMAITHLNLTNWDKYSAEKQADKASAMCEMITKEKMPPKNFIKSHPDGILSPEELKTICDWAGSIQVTKK